MKMRTVEVQALKYDGSLSRTWNMRLVQADSEIIHLIGRFERAVSHPDLGVIAEGTSSLEFFWPARWYNVFKFVEPTGEFRNFYCNISMPPRFEGSRLEYVDLDLDIVIDSAGEVTVIDDTEFLENSARFGYPPDVIDGAHSAVTDLKQMINDRRFPFDIL